jgi:TPR repeat protein
MMNKFQDRPPLPRDWTREHVRTLRKLARDGDVDALVTLGDFCLEGLRHPDGTVLVRRNAREGRRHLERATELGDPSGMSSLAGYLSRRGASASEITRAEALYRRAFRMGYETAAFNLATTYKQLGRYRDAVRWYRRAHEAGDPSALLQLARAELYGVGTKRDPKAAIAKLRRVAAAQTKWWPPATGENVQAMIEIARVLLDGWLVPRNFDEAQRWLRRAAKWNSATANAMTEES